MAWEPEAIESRRSFEAAVDQIEFAITAGTLKVGDRLPSERVLAEAMGISRPTLREAVHVLSEAGVVDVRPGAGGGMFVRSDLIPISGVRARVETTIADVADVLEARRLVEPQVAQLAGIFATESDFRRLREIVGRQRLAGDDRDQLFQLNQQFHLRIAQAAGNRVLVNIMRSLLLRLSIAGDADYHAPAEPERALAAHEETLVAIMSRDPGEIDTAVDRHLRILEDLWEAEAGRLRLRRVGNDERIAPGVEAED
jgi:DNA-binding FadR family transcriptional regulator